MNAIKVLLADDHPLLRSGLMRLLDEGNEIEVVGQAENGREAVQKVLELKPDIVVMDISMPVMNGMEAAKEITQRDHDVKVLFLTVHDSEEFLHKAFQAGAVGYVLKKAADNDLLNAINVVARGEYFLYPGVTRTIVENYMEKPGSRHASSAGDDLLTDRECEVLKLVAEGYTCREIAEQLYISKKTVETHKAKIMSKLNLHKRAELVHYAISKGLLQMDFDDVKDEE